jgi:hypothetical protein
MLRCRISPVNGVSICAPMYFSTIGSRTAMSVAKDVCLNRDRRLHAPTKSKKVGLCQEARNRHCSLHETLRVMSIVSARRQRLKAPPSCGLERMRHTVS